VKSHTTEGDTLIVKWENDLPSYGLDHESKYSISQLVASDQHKHGNLVPQLHVHVIARRSSDVAWPRPVWGVMPPLAHDAEEVQNFISALRRKIWLG